MVRMKNEASLRWEWSVFIDGMEPSEVSPLPPTVLLGCGDEPIEAIVNIPK